MVFLGTDFSRKHIFAEIEGKDVSIEFNDSFFKGVYNVSIRVNDHNGNLNNKPVKIESAYPGLWRRVQEAMLLIQLALKNVVVRRTKRN